MSNGLKKQTANTAEKRKVLPGECDKKLDITKLPLFQDYKLSRSQLRQLTDLLDIPEEEYAIKDNNNSLKKESDKMKSDGSLKNKNGHLLKTKMRADEVKCCSSVSKDVKTDTRKYYPVINRKVVVKSECLSDSEDEESSVSTIDVAGGGENDDEETGMSVLTESADRGVKCPSVVEGSCSNEQRNGTYKELHCEEATNYISSQVFKCMLCGDKNVYVPLDQILVHRWQHYQEIMTYNQYVEGLMEYPSGFKKPPASTNSTGEATSSSHPLLLSPTDFNNGTGYSELAHMIVENPPSFEVEVIVTTDD